MPWCGSGYRPDRSNGPAPYASFEKEAGALATPGRLLAPPPPAEATYIARHLPPCDGAAGFLETRRAVCAEVRGWLDGIDAPRKRFAVLPGAGHNTLAFPDRVLDFLDRHVGRAGDV